MSLKRAVSSTSPRWSRSSPLSFCSSWALFMIARMMSKMRTRTIDPSPAWVYSNQSIFPKARGPPAQATNSAAISSGWGSGARPSFSLSSLATSSARAGFAAFAFAMNVTPVASVRFRHIRATRPA
jgi:hypothetical protein